MPLSLEYIPTADQQAFDQIFAQKQYAGNLTEEDVTNSVAPVLDVILRGITNAYTSEEPVERTGITTDFNRANVQRLLERKIGIEPGLKGLVDIINLSNKSKRKLLKWNIKRKLRGSDKFYLDVDEIHPKDRYGVVINIGKGQEKNIDSLKSILTENLIDMGQLLNRRFPNRKFPITSVYEINIPSTDEILNWITTGLKEDTGKSYTIYESKIKDEQRPYGLAMLKGIKPKPFQFFLGQHNILLNRNKYTRYPFNFGKDDEPYIIYKDKKANKPYEIKNIEKFVLKKVAGEIPTETLDTV